MLGTYSYHEIIKKTVVGFGTLFNNIELRRTDNAGNIEEVMKVPLAYGPKQKFLARLRQVGDLTQKDQVQITLPRISFEISGISYDPTRKVSPTQYIRNTTDNGKQVKMFAPIPTTSTLRWRSLLKTRMIRCRSWSKFFHNSNPVSISQ